MFYESLLLYVMSFLQAEFFRKRYPALSNRNGTKYLVKKLNTLLLSHIRNYLPDLKSRVNMTISRYQNLLDSYGDPVVDQHSTILRILTQFASTYCQTVEGTSQNIAVSEICGGARICYIFHDIFGKTLENFDALSGLTTKVR